MFEFIFVGFLAATLLFLYCFIKRPIAIIGLLRRVPKANVRADKRKFYLERFGESRRSAFSRNIVVQVLPWIAVLATVFILGNQYFYFGTVLSGSMEPIFKRGDLVLMQTIDKQPEVGEIIMYVPSDFTKKISEPITHRVINIDKDGNIFTRGDANPKMDQWVLKIENIMGKAISFKGQPIIIRGLGSILVPEAGDFSIMNNLPEGMEFTVVFQRFRAMQPLIILFATIFYIFILMETRSDNERRFKGKSEKK